MAEEYLLHWPAPDRTVLLSEAGEKISWSRLAGQVRALEAALSDTTHIANLCQGRQEFLVTLLAVALAGKTALLPSERSAGALGKLAAEFPGLAAITDSEAELAILGSADIPAQTVAHSSGSDGIFDEKDWRRILAAPIIQFTSGSTGRPEPNGKTVDYIYEGARGNAAAMIDGLDGTPSIVATVPPYHMYGLETTVALALFADCQIYAGRPFYPADIAAALESVPEPRLLVSTPAHLRVLAESGIAIPATARIFSATAPLPVPLAVSLERLCGGEIREIYGTTEAGIVGWRRTAVERAFRPVGKMSVVPDAEGALVTAPHMEKPTMLFDRMEVDDAGRFLIAGRSNDIVNIAGKRMSLSGMNAILTEIEGVVDGAFLAPADAADGPVGRAIAIVVARGLSAAEIRASLKRSLDPAFLPRRILFVDSLPRNPAGKLPVAALREFALARLMEEFRAERTVEFAAAEPYFAGHFPGAPIVPGAVLLDEACSLFEEGLCGLGMSSEIVSAKFPASAGPGEPCHFQATASGDRRVRIEGSQNGRTIMRAVFEAVGDDADV